MDRAEKRPPAYAVASVDHALRIATMLQLEGPLTVAELAERVGVARSTAHRLLQTLVYRDYAVQQEDRSYRVGPVLELAAHSQSAVSRLRAAALPRLRWLVDVLGESANLIVRTGTTVRFVAGVETDQSLRVSTREGMVFPAHRTSGGLLLLAELSGTELDRLYAQEQSGEQAAESPDLRKLRRELPTLRRNGFAVNDGRSERGVVAVGVRLPIEDQAYAAALSVSMPRIRYDKKDLPRFVAALRTAADAVVEHLGDTDQVSG
ncbi:IclR family transcriptional regulator [Enemella evansiae]|uniref:Transcriptional regulator n=1 Tax=Enemella evansiae TaxID=2016499 RepID=A0A255G880_9ACTN|nr:IclR family transcriptional regulator [Enemella evansiae]PFG67177.1 IclR family transcriptional regulator [Propionibacteriaceae bacterium ES.041]OYN98271.1 transcriptional regulator [Enemella evansiae]OYN99260.1 transcriptional regulator [Enemella evansiae]OYO05353.1 transcriptional regulator [Enemella evansiae]OYO10606.1 transcriptional regulator [Enemella evansiae]